MNRYRVTDTITYRREFHVYALNEDDAIARADSGDVLPVYKEQEDSTPWEVEPMAGDTVGDIIRYENGDMDGDETVAFFQRIIDNGLVWQLQGSYERMARAFLADGYCQPPDEGTEHETQA